VPPRKPPRKPPARVLDRAWGLLGRMDNVAAKSGDPRPRALLVKLGAMGSALFSGCRADDGSEVEPSAVWQPAFRPDGRVVDTTGAGDCFTAAFAVARFAEKRSAREALRFATAAACLCVQRAGAQPSMPRREEVEDLLRRREGESRAFEMKK
jgi:sugar/nucleoside kinase (ribokinase family)